MPRFTKRNFYSLHAKYVLREIHITCTMLFLYGTLWSGEGGGRPYCGIKRIAVLRLLHVRNIRFILVASKRQTSLSTEIWWATEAHPCQTDTSRLAQAHVENPSGCYPLGRRQNRTPRPNFVRKHIQCTDYTKHPTCVELGICQLDLIDADELCL